MKPIKKAVIAAAGKGTRFLPATKILPKEMLPILEKPGIQYIVEEFIESGITEIAIVTGGGAKERIFKEYFSPSPELEKYLLENNKEEELKKVKEVVNLANITFIKQEGPYGNGTPCLSAKDFIETEPFIYAYGDDLVLSPRKPMTRAIIEKYEETGEIVAAAQEIPKSETYRYGIAHIKDADSLEFDFIVEKPRIEEAPSKYATFGRYLLVPEIIQILEEKKLGKNNELWTTDAITEYIRSGGRGYIAEVPKDGRWFTTGDPLRFLQTSIRYALEKDEYKEDLKNFINLIGDEK